MEFGNFKSNNKTQYLYLCYIFFLNIALISLLLIIINSIYNFHLSVKWFFGIFIFALLIALISKYNKDRIDNHTNKVVDSIFEVAPYFFLAILISLIINQFLHLSFISSQNFKFFIMGIFFGFLTFYHKSTKIEEDIEKERQSERVREQLRFTDFVYRYPKIAKVPIIRNIGKWLYKEGWIYSISLFIIAIFGLILRIWNITGVKINVDEAIMALAVNGVMHSGSPLMPSGTLYLHGILSTYLISFSSLLFGLNEFGLRIFIVLAGILAIFLIYFISKEFTNKKFALIISLVVSLLALEIAFSRFARFYAFLQLFYLLDFYLLIKYFKTNKRIFLFSVIIIGILTFLIQREGILALFFTILFLIIYKIESIKNNPKKIISGLLIVGVFILLLWSKLVYLFHNYIYGSAASYQLNKVFSSIGNSFTLITANTSLLFLMLAVIGIMLLLFLNKRDRIKNSALIVYSVVAIILIDLIIYSQGFGYRVRYIYFIIPLFILLTGYFVYFTSKSKIGLLKPIFLIIFLITIFGANLLIIPQNTYKLELSQEMTNKDLNLIKTIVKNDTLIIASPIEVLYFYGIQPNYWIVSHQGEIDLYSTNGLYSYTNTPIISNSSELSKLENNYSSIIIVIDDDRWRFVDSELRKYILNNYKKYQTIEERTEVYYFTS